MAAIRGKSEINTAAVESLGIIGDKRAISVLNELLVYGDIRLRETVREAINKILTKNALIKLRKRKSLQKK
jgi:HEAT repeat protein